MHQAATFTFPAPIVSARPPLSSHYAPYNPRTSPQSTSRSTSEFKGSTNPSEDWTKISDLAERRRIQNRIAQRNYRKKLKRRLEDLERRAQSRSISPNGDDTDGRSTRESSSEQVHTGASSTSATPTTTTSSPPASQIIESSTSPAVSTGYEYTTPSYATSTASTPYPSQYRTASSMAYSSSASPATTYVSAPLDYSQAPSTGYMYAPYDHHTQQSQTDMSVIDPSFILPHPSTIGSSSTSRIPGVMRTGGMYETDTTNTISPYFTTYDIQDPYFSAGGVSSSYYNLDNLNPLPPLLNAHTTSHYASQRN